MTAFSHGAREKAGQQHQLGICFTLAVLICYFFHWRLGCEMLDGLVWCECVCSVSLATFCFQRIKLCFFASRSLVHFYVVPCQAGAWRVMERSGAFWAKGVFSLLKFRGSYSFVILFRHAFKVEKRIQGSFKIYWDTRDSRQRWSWNQNQIGWTTEHSRFHWPKFTNSS